MPEGRKNRRILLNICPPSTSVEAKSSCISPKRRRKPITSRFTSITLLFCVLALGQWGLRPSACAADLRAVDRYSGKLVVLNYHHISADGQEGVATISAVRFEEHLKLLKAGGFSVVPLQKLCDFLRGAGTLPAKAVCLTFDDGYRSYADSAVPILKRYSYASTCFVVVADVGKPLSQGKLPHMNWSEMEKLTGTGLVSFGSHTYDSHGLLPGSDSSEFRTTLAFRLPSETASRYSSRVGNDLERSRSILAKRLRTRVEILAYPYGVSSRELISVAAAKGFRFMFTTTSGAVTAGTDPFRIPRINAGSSWVSPEYLAEQIRRAVR